jgi:hypothetical protein
MHSAPGFHVQGVFRWITEMLLPARQQVIVTHARPGFEPDWHEAVPDNPHASARVARAMRTRGAEGALARAAIMNKEMVPGPAGVAPASWRRDPHAPALVGQWDIVRRLRALWNAVELRIPVARGIRPCAPNSDWKEPARFELATVRLGNPHALGPMTGQVNGEDVSRSTR